MKALSIQQPWASLIIRGVPILVAKDNGDDSSRVEYSGKVIRKNIENRSWPLPEYMKGQRIYVHAGKRRDKDAMEWLMDSRLVAPVIALVLENETISPTGCIIGEVTITGCVTESKNIWFCGPYGFTLTDPKAYEKPFPYRGQLGFFEVIPPAEIEQ